MRVMKPSRSRGEGVHRREGLHPHDAGRQAAAGQHLVASRVRLAGAAEVGWLQN
jgi:hypothetical protein